MASSFIVIQDIPYEGGHITHYATEKEVKEYLKKQTQTWNADDFSIYEISRELSVYDLIKD